MDNKTRYDFLFSAASESLAEGEFSQKRGAFNLSVRRSQEAVELGLGALLAFLGVHYPKNHDQAPLIIKILKSKEIELNEGGAIEGISLDLSRKRGPALHQKSGFDELVAAKSLKDARLVLDFVELTKLKLIKKYGNQQLWRS